MKKRVLTTIGVLISFILVMSILNSCLDRNNTEFKDGFYPLVSKAFLPIIKCKVNGQIKNFVLDTGASISVVDESEFKKMGLTNRLIKEDVKVHGYGGTTTSLKTIVGLKVFADDVNFNKEWKLKDLSNLTRTFYRQTGIRVFGILGNNNLKSKGILIDLKGDKLWLKDQIEINLKTKNND